MEKELYKALALVLLEPRVDQWGNQINSPLKEAIEKWANEKREDIASAVVKNLGKEELAEKVSKKVVEELSKTSSWSTNYEAENLKKAVMEKVAHKLAEQHLEKLQNPPIISLAQEESN